MEEVGAISDETILNVMARREAKGKREVWLENVQGLKSEVSERMKAKEKVALLMLNKL